jgi:PHS family inorganic phosphate transporter-like MFS transporter
MNSIVNQDHIQTMLFQLKYLHSIVLSDISIAMTSSLWSKVKLLIVVGVGFFCDGYLNITIGLVVPILGYIYFKDEHNKVPTVQGDIIKGALSLGMIAGQLFFGVFGDAFGRHAVYGKELLLTIMGTLLVILLPWHGLSHNAIVAWIAVFRVITGLGTGGDYPMTSALCTEHTEFLTRAKRVLLVFASLGLGSMVAGIVYMVLLSAFKDSILRNINHLEWGKFLFLSFTLDRTITFEGLIHV